MCLGLGPVCLREAELNASIYFTICARNYLAFALACRASLLRAKPDARFIIFLADDPLAEEIEGVEIVPVGQMDVPRLYEMAFRYDVMEFCTALKPVAFRYVFDQLGAETGVYLDADTFVLRSLHAVKEGFAEGAEALLTPHLTAPLPADGLLPGDLEILASGAFNAGFLAFRDTPSARRFLDWWEGHLQRDCVVDASRSLFADQTYLQMAPGFLGTCRIVRDPGYNLAYWNLSQREVAGEGEQLTANGEPLVFCHFSGASPDRPEIFSRHQTRFGLADLPRPLQALFADYLQRVREAGHDRFRAIPYGFAAYTDGTPIPSVARKLPRALSEPEWADRETAFRPDHAALNRPSPRVDPDPAAPITVLMHAIYDRRPDLNAAFPLGTRAGRHGYYQWFMRYIAAEKALPEVFLAPAQQGGGQLWLHRLKNRLGRLKRGGRPG